MKKNLLVTLVLGLSLILLLSACSAVKGNEAADDPQENPAASDGTAYHKITAEEAGKMMEEGDVTIIDVRTPEEYAEAHIPGAVNIPNEEIGSEPPGELTDQEATLIVYCRTGVRSKQASNQLVKLGFQKVYDMGGIVDWNGDTESGGGDVEQ